ncbi:MAG TPA: hypothetical protein VH083_27025 [Myxococcales bacterium]|nr:hypothetical protein [Myxococcales bacterium]
MKTKWHHSIVFLSLALTGTAHAQFIGAPPRLHAPVKSPAQITAEQELEEAKQGLAVKNAVETTSNKADLVEAQGKVDTKQKALDDATDAATPAATWRILGSGYGQLLNATDSSTAFSLAVAYQFGDIDALIQLQRGNQTDPLTTPKAVGQFLLSPLAGAYSAGLAIDYRPKHFNILGRADANAAGVYGYFNAGTSTWQGAERHARPNDGLPAPLIISVDAIGLSAGAGLSAQVFSLPSDTTEGLPGTGNRIAVTLRAGLAYRGIAGTVLGAPSFREQMTSRQDTAFFGGELQLALQINSITAAIAVPVLGGHLDGLTNGQVVPSLLLGGSIDVSPPKS